MSRLRQNDKLLFSVDDVGVTKIFSRNYDVDSVDEVTDDFAAGNSRTYTIAPNTAQSIDLAGLTLAKFVYVESVTRIVVTFNGGSDIPVTPRNNAVVADSILPGRLLLWTDGFTSIGLRNESATETAYVTVVLGG